jgi:hypothetical protein
MANSEHVEIFRKGVSEWNLWREANPKLKPDLSGENFTSNILQENETDLNFILVSCHASIDG